MKRIKQVNEGIFVLDSGYLRAGMDAIYLIESAGRIALVESGTTHSVAGVKDAVKAIGRQPEDVDWLLLTHVHLDHAGGAGALLREFPEARLVVHPRGARHMVAPERLWAGTVAVYGEEFAHRVYGELVPVAAGRVIEAREGMEILVGNRSIEVMDAPGHARHHVCYFDVISRSWFSGDAFGLSYREAHRDGRAFIFPATTPVQFEPEAMHATIDRMLERGPQSMFLTHYGPVKEIPRLAADLHRLIDASVDIAIYAQEEDLYDAIRVGLGALLRQEAATQGWAVQGAEAEDLYAIDLDLNAQGLKSWLDSKA